MRKGSWFGNCNVYSNILSSLEKTLSTILKSAPFQKELQDLEIPRFATLNNVYLLMNKQCSLFKILFWTLGPVFCIKIK